jgi:hypothetical protein
LAPPGLVDLERTIEQGEELFANLIACRNLMRPRQTNKGLLVANHRREINAHLIEAHHGGRCRLAETTQPLHHDEIVGRLVGVHVCAHARNDFRIKAH